ncbi:MAG: sugar kinase, partial [Cellulosimicrobium funkei]
MEELLKFAPRPTGAGDMFQLLRDGQPRTRADLAAITGQARSTIAARIDLLMTAGLIAPAGEA